jgi:hypothetical protein
MIGKVPLYSYWLMYASQESCLTLNGIALRLFTNSKYAGLYGLTRGFILVSLPLAALHGPQAVTVLSNTVRPPWLTGLT